MKIFLVSILGAFTTSAGADFIRHRGLTPVDASECIDGGDAVFAIPAEFNPCGFPLIVAGFGVSGLPDAAPQWNGGEGPRKKNNGVNPDTGFYRVGEDLSCASIEATYIKKGTGANFDAPPDGPCEAFEDGEGDFSWIGAWVMYRPSGQVTLDPDFPDYQEDEDGNPAPGIGGIWLVNGKADYCGNNFVLKSFDGQVGDDICAALAA